MLIGGRYRLSQPIGRGPSGFLWVAQDSKVQRTVAAKPIPLTRGGSPLMSDAALAYALHQARLAKGLKHQCAVPVYDVFVEGDDIWLIMEYVPARAMSDFLAGHGQLSETDVATLGAQLAAALAAAHEHGLLHRAVEPANVLLADDGGVQITEFGIGVLHQDPAFRAPEVTAGGIPTAASDVFSLGATLFFALEATAPFGPQGTGPVPPVPHNVTGLHHVLMRMLSADPALRPSTAGAWRALAAIAEGVQPPSDALIGSMPAVAVAPAPVAQAAPAPATVDDWSQPTLPAMAPVPAAPQAVSSNVASSGGGRLLVFVAVLLAATAGVVFTELFLL